MDPRSTKDQPKIHPRSTQYLQKKSKISHGSTKHPKSTKYLPKIHPKIQPESKMHPGSTPRSAQHPPQDPPEIHTRSTISKIRSMKPHTLQIPPRSHTLHAAHTKETCANNVCIFETRAQSSRFLSRCLVHSLRTRRRLRSAVRL